MLTLSDDSWLFFSLFCLRRLSREGIDALPGLQTKLTHVPAISGEVLAELLVLEGDGVLADVGQAEEGEGGGEDAQTRADVEGVLVLGGRVASGLLDVGKDVDADEGADLADGRRDAVVLTPDTRGARLGGQEADIVARTQLAKAEEDAVDDDESADDARLG